MLLLLRDRQLAHRGLTLCLLFFLLIFVTGCTDPYATKLPLDGRLTPTEISKISEKLEPADQITFRLWAERRANGKEYGGEGVAPTVKIALLNQAYFDARQKEDFEATKAQKLLDEKNARKKEEEVKQQLAQLDQIAEKRRKVDVEISKYFTAEAIGYEWSPLLNRNGEEFARQWIFKLKLTNKSTKIITGAAGWATISDVFNADLGSYPIRIEPKINPGKIIDYLVVMDYNRGNPKHVEMSRTQSLRVKWFFESVAFSDGTNVDYKALNSEVQMSIPVTTHSQIQKTL